MCPPTPTRGVITTLPGYVTDPVLDDVESWPTVRVPIGSTAKRVSRALDAMAHRPALVVVDGLGGAGEEQGTLDGSGGGALGGIGDDEMNHAFHMRVKRITHTWCCYVNGTVDHIMTPYTTAERM